MSKQKSIVLAYARLGNTCEVQEIRNSALLKPGDWINQDYVKMLCASPEWEVAIVSLHISMPADAVSALAPVVGLVL
jgi:hypothetical protein